MFIYSVRYAFSQVFFSVYILHTLVIIILSGDKNKNKIVRTLLIHIKYFGSHKVQTATVKIKNRLCCSRLAV